MKTPQEYYDDADGDPKKMGKAYTADIAKEFVGVQPMPNIDLMKVAEHPIWQSFWERHTK
ncbi:MAG: hypothetical protein HOH03_10295 [Candidatus Marinimicrobia bacterium]|jgi:hypothetical protein|nr:hypothetical protein [Candidatus Neomarinimicrobiota bacterium]